VILEREQVLVARNSSEQLGVRVDEELESSDVVCDDRVVESFQKILVVVC
jgi:hypothetical protein